MDAAIKTEHPPPISSSPPPPPIAGILRTSGHHEASTTNAASSSSMTSSSGGGGEHHHPIGPTVSFSLPHIVQHIVHSPSSATTTNGQEDVISEEEAKRRRELLARRPSYRKILNDLSCVELDLQPESDSGGESSEESSSNSAMTGSQAGMPSSTLSTTDTISYVASIPTGGLHLPTNVNGDLHGNLLHQVGGPGLLQYPLSGVGGADLLGLKPLGHQGGHHHSLGLTQGLMGFSSSAGPSSSKHHHQPPRAHSASDGMPVVEEATKKREIRLLKNREAAKECRRKKKDYVKCLENRVTVLETQNKQLIEELRALKDLYCRKVD